MYGGLVAGEGSFYVQERGRGFFADGSPRLRFAFKVTMAERDRALLQGLRDFLGAGALRDDTPPRLPHWLPTVTFAITAERTHLAVTIPFGERYLLPCAKLDQFDAWKHRLLDYRAARPTQYGRGPSPCSVEGCEKPVRGQRLCRSHYYRATGY